MRHLLPLLALSLLMPLGSQASVLKIATLSPDGSSWMTMMRAGAREIASRTERRVRIKFYPGGVMGDDQAVLRKLRIGQLQGGAVTIGTLSQIYPDSQVYNLPMLFRTLDEVSYIRRHMDADLLKGLEQNGFISFGLAEGGFAYLLSQKPIADVMSLRQRKTWIPSNDMFAMEGVKAFQINPIPLPMGDVLTGLQTGLVDTVAAPPIAILALHWHTQVKYLTNLPLLYTYGVLILKQRAFNKLAAKDQLIVREVMQNVFRNIDQQNRRDNVAAFAALRKQDIQFLRPSPAQTAEWRKYAAAARARLAEKGKLGRQIVEQIETLLAEYRQQAR
jgi:TRAP-type C4-dicarboxylate transport system substrate-binding protein